ncbi:response regulator transcription factor [Sphingopyxis indica]|uniref:response regulator transcription factor n=1 Tax=Sphingopyxis indica TaxID=436663 RepID=UPI0029392073|nr:response regulator transcription factor [Sphingopyxis indica]
MSDSKQIALLGRNALIREGLRHILAKEDFDIAYSLEDPRHLIDAGQGGDGIEMIVLDQGSSAYVREDIRTLQARYPDARLVLLAESFDFDNMVFAFRAGMHGYIVKDMPCERLVGSLRLVALGERVVPGELIDQLPGAPGAFAAASAASEEICEMLSDREVEILRCLVVGYPNKLISRRLDISEATVKVHVKAILRKLKVQNRTQAAIYALHHGIDGNQAESGPAEIETDIALAPNPMHAHFAMPPAPAQVAA